MKADKNGITIEFSETQQLKVPYKTGSNLPIIPVILALKQITFAEQIPKANKAVTDIDNINLLQSQQELLSWHWRLGHIALSWVQELL